MKSPPRRSPVRDGAHRLARVIETRLLDPRPAGMPRSSASVEARKRAHAEFSEVWASVSRDPARDEFSQAALRWLDGKDAEAAAGLDRYVEKYPADPDAWRLRAMARLAAGDSAGADADLSMANPVFRQGTWCTG
jgi:predicted Zn-dependent protease